MADPLLHPRLRGTLTDFYPSTIAIEAVGMGQDPITGEPLPEWDALPGWESVRASIVPVSALEQGGVAAELATVRLRVYLQGYCPEATREMRVHRLDDDLLAQIEGVQHDSRRFMTVLLTEDFSL